MTGYRIHSHAELKRQMKAVARGDEPAPADAGQTSFHSLDTIMRLLTPENRALLAILRDRKPQSIAELAELSGRAASNLTRTLAKLEAVGLVAMKVVDRRKVPTPLVARLHVEIDPYSQNDRFEMA
jgi:predicted transcriptional regulator